jgi:hypothetical protein
MCLSGTPGPFGSPSSEHCSFCAELLTQVGSTELFSEEIRLWAQATSCQGSLT